MRMTEKEIQEQLMRFAGEVKNCRSKDDADELMRRIKAFVLTQNCIQAYLKVFSFSKSGNELLAWYPHCKSSFEPHEECMGQHMYPCADNKNGNENRSSSKSNKYPFLTVENTMDVFVPNKNIVSMCLDEKRSILYACGETMIYAYSFPEMEMIAKWRGSKGITLSLHKDGELLCACSNHNSVSIYATTDRFKQVYHRSWPLTTTTIAAHVEMSNQLLIPVGNGIVGIDMDHLDGSEEIVPIQSLDRIMSISAYGDFVVYSRINHDEEALSICAADGKLEFAEIIRRSLDGEAMEHANLLVVPRRKILACTTVPWLPSYLYIPEENGTYLKRNELTLSSVWFPVLSNGGRYMSFISDITNCVDSSYKPNIAVLVDVNTWDTVSRYELESSLVFRTSFSTNGNYWLIPGNKALVREIR